MVGEIRPIFTAVVAHGCMHAAHVLWLVFVLFCLQGSWCNVAILITGSHESPKPFSSTHLFSPPKAAKGP